MFIHRSNIMEWARTKKLQHLQIWDPGQAPLRHLVELNGRAGIALTAILIRIRTINIPAVLSRVCTDAICAIYTEWLAPEIRTIRIEVVHLIPILIEHKHGQVSCHPNQNNHHTYLDIELGWFYWKFIEQINLQRVQWIRRQWRQVSTAKNARIYITPISQGAD